MTWQLLPAGELARHAAQWDVLQARCANVPFLESSFLLPLLGVFGRGDELLALRQGTTGLEAAAILRQKAWGQWETFQPSQLPLGPLLCSGALPLAQLLKELSGSLPGPVLALGATQVDPRLLARPLDGASSIRTQDYISTSYINVGGSFEAYWDARGKNLRQNLRKQRNRLQSEGATLRLECMTEPAQMPEAVAQFGHLESAGWKAQSGTAIHADNDQGRYYRLMMQAFAEKGRARAYRYWLNDSVVSMDLCIDNGPVVVILKTTYDEQHRQVSPAMLMRQEQFAQWWSEGRYRRIEFYGKTLEWHTRLTDQTSVLYHATRYRWPWLLQLLTRRAQRTDVAQPADAGA